MYVASLDEDLKGEGAVFAIDAKTGELQWKYPVRNSIKNTIAVDEGTVFAQDAEGYLYAIDNHRQGKLKWDTKMNVAGLPVLVDGLTATDGIVYAGSGKAFGAYNGKTGEAIAEQRLAARRSHDIDSPARKRSCCFRCKLAGLLRQRRTTGR